LLSPPSLRRDRNRLHHLTRSLEIHRKQSAHAAFLHGDAVEAVHAGHGHVVVGDDQEAGAGFGDHVGEQGAEAVDIGVIERGVDFVEHADRGGVAAEDGEDQRQRGEGLFAAGEQREGGEFLARRLGVDFEAGEERVVGADQSEVGAAAAEHSCEELLEVAVDLGEDLVEALAAFSVEVADRAAQLVDGGGEFGAFGVDAGEAGFDLGGFELGAQVDRAHFLALAGEAFVFAPGAVFGLGGEVGGRGQFGVDAEAFEDAFGDTAPGVIGVTAVGFAAQGGFAGGGEGGVGVAVRAGGSGGGGFRVLEALGAGAVVLFGGGQRGCGFGLGLGEGVGAGGEG
jgi:hypothetical protein